MSSRNVWPWFSTTSRSKLRKSYCSWFGTNSDSLDKYMVCLSWVRVQKNKALCRSSHRNEYCNRKSKRPKPIKTEPSNLSTQKVFRESSRHSVFGGLLEPSSGKPYQRPLKLPNSSYLTIEHISSYCLKNQFQYVASDFLEEFRQKFSNKGIA